MDDIRKKARERGEKLKLSYAGAVLPAEAHALMQKGAKLVDVRTDAELHYVGSVPGAKAIEWNTYPEGQRNPAFLEQLGEAVRKDEPVMFLCRSGVRSHSAAIAATRAAGGLVLDPIVLPSGERACVCDDPQGAAFALLERRPL